MNILDFTSVFKDKRRSQGLRHSLTDLLSIIVMAILSGEQGFRGFARFTLSNKEELESVFEFKHGIPKYNTFRSVLNSLDESELLNSFEGWVSSINSCLTDDYIAFDGKAIRASVVSGGNKEQNFVAMVSAFGHASNLVYGSLSYENKKSGEAAAVRALMEKLGFKGKTFTLDALHCQKKTLVQAVKQGCDVIVQVKGNCPKLLSDLKQASATKESISSYTYTENEVTRSVQLFDVEGLVGKNWVTVHTLAVVHRQGKRAGKDFEHTAYYALTKKEKEAKMAAVGIHKHWNIENKLHWVKDVLLGEDDMTTKEKEAFVSTSVLNNIAVNIFSINKITPNKYSMALYKNKVNKLYSLLYG